MSSYKNNVLFVIIYVVLSCANTYSATYYISNSLGIDSNSGTSKAEPWKHCPGMTGFSGSYTHSDGDKFVFYGGDTWTYTSSPLLQVGYSGSSGSNDQYTIDATWYSGDSWTNPIFDGDSKGGAGGYVVQISGKEYVVVDGLKIQNYWCATGDGTGLNVNNSSNIEIKNCIFDTYSVNAFSFSGGTVANKSNILIHDNVVYHAGRVRGAFGSYLYNYVLDNVQIYNNTFYGQGTPAPLGCCTDIDCESVCSPLYSCCYYHGDGIMVEADGNNTCGRSDCSGITNLYIYNNRFLGTWLNTSAFVLLSLTNASRPSINGAFIYNNIFTVDNDNCTSYVQAYIWSYAQNKNVRVFNNSFSGDKCAATNPTTAISMAGANGTFSNNIFSGFANGIVISGGVGEVELGNNIYHDFVSPKRLVWDARSGGDAYYACNSVQGRFGSAYCSTDDPGYNSYDGASGFVPLISSPAIDNGADLSSYSLSATDILGTTRGTTWDIGAYEYASSPDPPASPHKGRITAGAFSGTMR